MNIRIKLKHSQDPFFASITKPVAAKRSLKFKLLARNECRRSQRALTRKQMTKKSEVETVASVHVLFLSFE